MIGQLVGHYKVVRKIGDGGMGSVFEAIHEGIGRRVAIKVLHSTFSKDPTIVARFFNEARAVNIVPHPGIVGSFDYGQQDDGTAYIVMEYVEGELLSGRIKRLPGGLGNDSLRIGRQIAATLAAAHARGIIHRDLKPDNIFIVPDSEAPGGERAKVLDFGIAKIVSEQPSGKPSAALTQAGAAMGTPKYMSPEQCRGAAKVDFKTDVYALGVMMFEMLCGKLPFEAEGTGSMMALHMFQPPPLLHDIDPSISPPVEQLVMSMLAKDQTVRPTMSEVVSKIEQMGVKSTGLIQAIGPLSQPSAAHTIPADSSGPLSTSRPSLVGLGQTQDPTKIQLLGHRSKRVAITAGIAIVLIGIGLVVGLRRPSPAPALSLPPPPPAATPAVAPPKQVIWQITTNPPGAEVVRISDGEVLGLTPWKSEQPAGTGKFGINLRRNGYADSQVLLNRETDANEKIELAPIPVPPAEVETPKKPSRSKRTSKAAKSATSATSVKKQEAPEEQTSSIGIVP